MLQRGGGGGGGGKNILVTYHQYRLDNNEVTYRQ